MHDVGVGEQQIVGRLRERDGRVDALLHRPELAGPPGGNARLVTTHKRSATPLALATLCAISPVPSLLSSSTSMTDQSPG